MLIGGIVLGLVMGLVAGGTLGNLATIRLRSTWLLLVAVVLRYGTEILLGAHVAPIEALRLPLLSAAFAFLLVGLWKNRTYPGLSLAFVGILSNATVIVVNGGYMPIWEPSLRVAGFDPATTISVLHTILPATLDASFLLHLGPFADVIPIPLPFIQNVASVGDAFLAAGLGLLPLCRRRAGPAGAHPGAARGDPTPARRDGRPRRAGHGLRARGRLRDRPDAGDRRKRRPRATRCLRWGRPTPELPIVRAICGRFAVDAPARRRVGRVGAAADSGASTAAATDASTTALPIPRLPVEAVARVRQHPYVRLALNSSFSALWAGQLISVFGDRLHQLALVAVVGISTGSALATGLVFFAATLPNLILSPIAGTFVDRWNHKEVLIVSDILRAALVPAHPGRAHDQRDPGLPDGVRDHDHLDLLPTCAGGDPAAHRRGA